MSVTKWIKARFNPAIVAGLKAEEIFQDMAEGKGWILEVINQDRDSFDKYQKHSDASIKRGDFLCRNCANAEIEVKCKQIYEHRGEPCYLLEYSHVKRHEAMQALTKSPVVFAVFERDGSRVVWKHLRMFTLDYILQTPEYRRGELYDRKNKCIRIPFRYARPGFRVLQLLGGQGEA